MTFSHLPRWSPTPQSNAWDSSFLFPERSSQPQLETQIEENSQDQPDLQAQLKRADRLGHHFGRISVLSSDPSTQVQTQPQQTEEQEPETITSEPRLSFVLGSGAPPDVPNSPSGSTQPQSFLQLSPLPNRQTTKPQISRHATVAAELTQLLQARQEQPSSETLPASSADNPPSSDPNAFVSDFQQALLDNTLARLQTNRSRLESADDPYQNTDPANPQWKHLRELSDADYCLGLKQGQLGQSLTQLLEQLTLTKPAWSGIFTIPAQGSFDARRQQILSYLGHCRSRSLNV